MGEINFYELISLNDFCSGEHCLPSFICPISDNRNWFGFSGPIIVNFALCIELSCELN